MKTMVVVLVNAEDRGEMDLFDNILNWCGDMMEFRFDREPIEMKGRFLIPVFVYGEAEVAGYVKQAFKDYRERLKEAYQEAIANSEATV